VIANGTDRVRPAKGASVNGVTDSDPHAALTALEILGCDQSGFYGSHLAHPPEPKLQCFAPLASPFQFSTVKKAMC